MDTEAEVALILDFSEKEKQFWSCSLEGRKEGEAGRGGGALQSQWAQDSVWYCLAFVTGSRQTHTDNNTMSE